MACKYSLDGSGFSFIELLVVVAIIAIVLALAIPPFMVKNDELITGIVIDRVLVESYDETQLTTIGTVHIPTTVNHPARYILVVAGKSGSDYEVIKVDVDKEYFYATTIGSAWGREK